MKTRHQLVAENTSLRKQLQELRDQISFLHRSITDRNLRTEKAERSEKASKACYEAIRKLYVDG